MRRYFYAGRSDGSVAWPELRVGRFGEVMWKKSKQMG